MNCPMLIVSDELMQQEKTGNFDPYDIIRALEQAGFKIVGPEPKYSEDDYWAAMYEIDEIVRVFVNNPLNFGKWLQLNFPNAIKKAKAKDV